MGLADPERVRILYRLEGLETQWTDPGIRRATTYTNLSPGRYRFEVIAANQEGEWNRKGATVDLVIKPTFFQDWPFKVMCAATILVLLWGAYQLRLRTLAARIQARLADRHDERERIARELHDTLAQSVQALILRVHLASTGLPPENPVRKDLEKTLEQAQKVLREARERIRDLRSLSVPDTLEPAITRAGVERGSFRAPVSSSPPAASRASSPVRSDRDRADRGRSAVQYRTACAGKPGGDRYRVPSQQHSDHLQGRWGRHKSGNPADGATGGALRAGRDARTGSTPPW
jgi:hypothetical protein